MPKKTKQQKKRSDSRKNLIPPIVVERTSAFTPRHTTQTKKERTDKIETNTIATTADLKKTLLIALGLFALEFLVFYAKLNSIL